MEVEFKDLKNGLECYLTLSAATMIVWFVMRL
jgi:hypothetical protein